MTVLIILSVAWCVISLIVVVYDFASFAADYLSRYRIGRWNSESEWFESAYSLCAKWAVKTPALKMNDNHKYLLLDILRGKKVEKMVTSWQKASCLIAVEDAKSSESATVVQAVIGQLIDDSGCWKSEPNRVDYAMISYALLRGIKNKKSIKPAMDSMFRYLQKCLCEDGMVCYSLGSEQRRYVDTVGFVCPFLYLYGKTYKVEFAKELAITQIELFHSRGMLDGIPVHCFRAKDDFPVGIYGWGRGSGWYALGLIDLLNEMLVDSETEEDNVERLRGLAVEFADRHSEFLRVEGGFSSVLTAFNRYESSATSLLGYFYANLARIESNKDYLDIASNCMTKIVQVTKRNGAVDQCQGDTIDIGILSEVYDEMPFAQGMSARLYLSLHGQADDL